MNKLARFPLKKKNATAAEFFHDLAIAAAEEPERFDRVIICMGGEDYTDTSTYGTMRLSEAIGLMELSKIYLEREW